MSSRAVFALDGAGHSRARIPPEWQLQVFVSDEVGYLRLMVTRQTCAGVIRAAAARCAGASSEGQISLKLDGRKLEDSETVEALELFSNANSLVVVVARDPPQCD